MIQVADFKNVGYKFSCYIPTALRLYKPSFVRSRQSDSYSLRLLRAFTSTETILRTVRDTILRTIRDTILRTIKDGEPNGGGDSSVVRAPDS